MQEEVEPDPEPVPTNPALPEPAFTFTTDKDPAEAAKAAQAEKKVDQNSRRRSVLRKLLRPADSPTRQVAGRGLETSLR